MNVTSCLGGFSHCYHCHPWQTCVITPDEGVEEGHEPASPQHANDDTGESYLPTAVRGAILHSHTLGQEPTDGTSLTLSHHGQCGYARSSDN